MFPSLKSENKEGCIRYFGWGSDPDGSAHCMSEEPALPSNPGGVMPQGPLNVTVGQLVTFAINWSIWHGSSIDLAIYVGTISGNISFPPYNVSYPRLVNTTLLASWTNNITFFGDPPAVTGPYLDKATYITSGAFPNYNPKILPNLNSAPMEAVQAWVRVENTVPITIPTLLAGTYTIRIILAHAQLPPPPSPNDVRVLGNPFITLWNWTYDPYGYPWGEFVDITTFIRPPTITILSPENKTYATNVSIPLNFTVDESTSWMGYSLDGQPNATITENTTLPTLSDGQHHGVVYANDTCGNMGTSTVSFTVDTTPPTANAGPDQTVDEDTVVTFNGSASTDENEIATYTWTFIDSTPQTLSGKNPTYTFATPGTYTVTLDVTDSVGNTATDTVTITVLDVTDPVADAGLDRTVNEDVSTTLDGSGSIDNVGITGYTWTFTDVTVKTLSGDKPSYTFSSPGVYTITLNVTDATGNWATDTVTITVIDVTSPSANAGSNQTVNEDILVMLDGSASSDNVAITSYTWTFIDGTAKTLSGEKPSYVFNTPGIYSITLNVSDSAGNYATDTVVITVLDVTNPVADAGQDQTVNVEDTVTFDAGGSTDNVGILSYEWDFGDGATGTGKTITYKYTDAGTYTVTLTVEDASGNQAIDTLAVTVNSTQAFPWWLVAAASIVAVGIVVTAIILWRKKASR